MQPPETRYAKVFVPSFEQERWYCEAVSRREAMADHDNQDEGLKWQVGVWDRISPIYLREIDNRFTGVIDGIIRHAGLQPGQQVLDLGTGTGSAAVKAALSVAPGGAVTAIDVGDVAG